MAKDASVVTPKEKADDTPTGGLAPDPTGRSLPFALAVSLVAVLVGAVGWFGVVGRQEGDETSDRTNEPQDHLSADWYLDAVSTVPDLSLSQVENLDRVGWCDEQRSVEVPSSGQVVPIEVGVDIPSTVAAAPAGTMFLFGAGVHTLLVPIEARSGDLFVGMDGAILDGGFGGDVGAIRGGGAGVEISSLTFRNFGTEDGRGSVNAAVVNRSVADGWVVRNNTFFNNDGAALFLGENSITENNCFEANGQYGVSLPSRQGPKGEVSIRNVTVRDNEFVGNNRNDLESIGACSGCTGAMKFWAPEGLVVTGNYIHDNFGPGVWVDHNGVDVEISNNVIEDNYKPGITIETSYNARVWNNYLAGNSVGGGEARPPTDPFPDAGIFISGSGGAEGIGAFAPVIDVAGNVLDGNYNGVTIFEDANRFCSAVANQSVGRCTLTGGTIDGCVTLADDPGAVGQFEEQCRWRSRKVVVRNNRFVAPPTRGGASCEQECSRNSAISTVANPTAQLTDTAGTSHIAQLAPRTDGGDDLSNPDLNVFVGNDYVGAWRFSGPMATDQLDAQSWLARGQDNESTGLEG